MLKQLLRLSFGGQVRWLTPAPSADIPISWAATRIEDALPGDLLLIQASELDAESLTKMDRGALAAILILGELKKNTVLPDWLPAASVSSTIDLRQAEQLLLTILVNQRAALAERGVRIHTQLSQLAAEGEGLEHLCQAMADISGRGVLVQDKRLGILAQHPSSALSAIWGDVLQQLSSPDALPEPLRDRKLAGQQHAILNQPVPGGLERLVATISVGEVARGYLSLVGLSGELDVLDEIVLEQGTLVCAVEMRRAKAVRETEKRLKGDLLTALLQDDLSPRDARLWVLTMGMDLDQAHVALRFAWDSPSPPSQRRLETLISGAIAQESLKVIVSPVGAEVVCFCQVPPDTTRPSPALDLASAVGAQGYHEYPQNPIRCGIGRPALDLNEWRTSFRQAGQALEMARRFSETAPLFYPDLSVYRLLLQMEHSAELSAFHEELLGLLLAHENSDELIHTLEAYFDHNGNLSQTAEALYVHRNTLLYRMERIAAITGLDLNDPKTRLAVQLALHIQRMIGSKHG